MRAKRRPESDPDEVHSEMGITIPVLFDAFDYAAHDENHNSAVALKEYLEK
jgi:uncharacterized protein YeaO (DUF488 family)